MKLYIFSNYHMVLEFPAEQKERAEAMIVETMGNQANFDKLKSLDGLEIIDLRQTKDVLRLHIKASYP